MRNGDRILSPVLAWKALSDPMEGPKNAKTVPDTFVLPHDTFVLPIARGRLLEKRFNNPVVAEHDWEE